MASLETRTSPTYSHSMRLLKSGDTLSVNQSSNSISNSVDSNRAQDAKMDYEFVDYRSLNWARREGQCK